MDQYLSNKESLDLHITQLHPPLNNKTYIESAKISTR